MRALRALIFLFLGAFLTVPAGPLAEVESPPPAASKPIGRDAPPPAAKKPSAEDEELARLLAGRYVQEVSVDLVMVPAVVLDRRGRPVLDLRREDFALFDEGRREKIDYFGVERAEPLSIAFLLDVSGSMRMSGAIDEAREVVRYFLARMGQRDEVSLIAFADRQVAQLTDFTADRGETMKYLEAVKAYGQTALNDAVAATPDLVRGSSRGRRAIVLLTDGVDNHSALTIDAATRAAQSVEMPFYTIGFSRTSREVTGSQSPETPAAASLRQIAEATGGKFFLIHDPDEMKEAVARMEEELRSQYVIGYEPDAAPQSGRYRRIALVADGGRYSVRARSGYIAGSH